MKRTTASPSGRWNLRAQSERKLTMTREEIYKLIADAKQALKPANQDAANVNTKVTGKAQVQYIKDVARIFGRNPDNQKITLPKDAHLIIQIVQQSKKITTLRKYARSVRHASIYNLNKHLNKIEEGQRCGNWLKVEKIVSTPEFKALTDLSGMLPADYRENWAPTIKRKSKKTSLSRLPKDWREKMVEKSEGQFRIPMMIAFLSGVRPEELQKGVQVKLFNNCLYVHIKGAKVKENAGQEYRQFKLAYHPLTDLLIKLLKENGQSEMLVKVDKGNSVTTHMRAVGKKIWPKRKESITAYTARHAMAADCKSAIVNGADPDLVSKVLGHCVDKTASFYGNRFQSGGTSVVPSDVQVPKAVRQKSKERNERRRTDNKVPSRKRKINFRPTF